eukprot:jgi/Mesvir1/19815/Mv13105-RA.1
MSPISATITDAFAKGVNMAQWESMCQAAEHGAMWRFLKNSCREGVDYRHADPSKSVWDVVSDPNSLSFYVADVQRRDVLLTPQCISDFLSKMSRWNDGHNDENERSCALATDRKRLGYVESLFVRAMMRDMKDTVTALREQLEVLTNRMDALESDHGDGSQNMCVTNDE